LKGFGGNAEEKNLEDGGKNGRVEPCPKRQENFLQKLQRSAKEIRSQ